MESSKKVVKARMRRSSARDRSVTSCPPSASMSSASGKSLPNSKRSADSFIRRGLGAAGSGKKQRNSHWVRSLEISGRSSKGKQVTAASSHMARSGVDGGDQVTEGTAGGEDLTMVPSKQPSGGPDWTGGEASQQHFPNLDFKEEYDYEYLPGLPDELGLQCLARLPLGEYVKLGCINKKLFKLAFGDDLLLIRRALKIREPWIYVVASGQAGWHALDPQTKRWSHLPVLDVDYCFNSCDKESFSVGSQLLVVGHSMVGLEMWVYDVMTNRWAKGSMMQTPRCLYAWASCGSFAYFAGGVTFTGEVLQSAEMYSPETGQWVNLPDMHECRRMSAGCFMDGKFYVLGGDNEARVHLSSGEVYDPATGTWTLIPKMLPWAESHTFPGAPPLIAVVHNNLYILETETNQLKVYLQATNSWKAMGEVPVRTDLVSGWGVAFKSLGEQLLLIGGARTPNDQDGLYVCTPDPEGCNSQWELLSDLFPFGPFVQNCAIVSA